MWYQRLLVRLAITMALIAVMSTITYCKPKKENKGDNEMDARLVALQGAWEETKFITDKGDLADADRAMFDMLKMD